MVDGKSHHMLMCSMMDDMSHGMLTWRVSCCRQRPVPHGHRHHDGLDTESMVAAVLEVLQSSSHRGRCTCNSLRRWEHTEV